MYDRTCTSVSNAIAAEVLYRAQSVFSGEVATNMIWRTQYLRGSVCTVLGLIPYSDLMPSCWILGQICWIVAFDERREAFALYEASTEQLRC